MSFPVLVSVDPFILNNLSLWFCRHWRQRLLHWKLPRVSQLVVHLLYRHPASLPALKSWFRFFSIASPDFLRFISSFLFIIIYSLPRCWHSSRAFQCFWAAKLPSRSISKAQGKVTECLNQYASIYVVVLQSDFKLLSVIATWQIIVLVKTHSVYMCSLLYHASFYWQELKGKLGSSGDSGDVAKLRAERDAVSVVFIWWDGEWAWNTHTR